MGKHPGVSQAAAAGLGVSGDVPQHERSVLGKKERLWGWEGGGLGQLGHCQWWGRIRVGFPTRYFPSSQSLPYKYQRSSFLSVAASKSEVEPSLWCESIQQAGPRLEVEEGGLRAVTLSPSFAQHALVAKLKEAKPSGLPRG